MRGVAFRLLLLLSLRTFRFEKVLSFFVVLLFKIGLSKGISGETFVLYPLLRCCNFTFLISRLSTVLYELVSSYRMLDEASSKMISFTEFWCEEALCGVTPAISIGKPGVATIAI